MLRRSVGRALAVIAVLAATLLAPSSAQADDNMPGSPPSSCPGSLLGGFPLTKNYGSGSLRLYVYYSSRDGGTNCAILRKGGSWSGQDGDLYVSIWKTDKGSDARWPDSAYDDGNYRYYAGAVYITGTNGKCVSVWGAALEYAPISKSRFACG